MVLLKTPVLEKPHLASFILEVGRCVLTELFDTLFPGQGKPIRLSFLEGDLGGGIGYATLPEVQANTHRALALINAGLHEAVGETLIALQAIGGELRYRLFGSVALEAFAGQLLYQLSLAVFAASQKVHGLFPSFERR